MPTQTVIDEFDELYDSAGNVTYFEVYLVWYRHSPCYGRHARPRQTVDNIKRSLMVECHGGVWLMMIDASREERLARRWV